MYVYILSTGDTINVTQVKEKMLPGLPTKHRLLNNRFGLSPANEVTTSQRFLYSHSEKKNVYIQWHVANKSIIYLLDATKNYTFV